MGFVNGDIFLFPPHFVPHPPDAYKKTTVNFVVHNFADFEKIYQRYFLRPAAQIFVDFGWDTSDIYDPNIVKKVHLIIKRLFDENKISENDLKQSYQRVIKIKSMINLI